ncbi:MAG: twin-arginine translocase TatA/TatE family subunit [Terriglobales bacterium]
MLTASHTLPPLRFTKYDECVSFSETIFLFLLALLVFGPKKLPEIGRQIGKMLNEFKRASNEFRSQIESEISQIDIENNHRQILPPYKTPEGSVAAFPMTPQPELPPVLATEPVPEESSESKFEVNSAGKASDV